MNIIEDKHYVSIPKQEYERMKKIVEDKKDILVNICIYTSVDDFGLQFHQEIASTKFIYEINESVPFSEIDKIQKLVKDSCNEIILINLKNMNKLKAELSKIYSKWWYKMFSNT